MTSTVNCSTRFKWASSPIPLSTADEDHSVWGVATGNSSIPEDRLLQYLCEGPDKRLSFCRSGGSLQAGRHPGTGRVLAQKTLKLNFWRPGDEHDPAEEEIFYGMPGQVDHEWVFR